MNWIIGKEVKHNPSHIHVCQAYIYIYTYIHIYIHIYTYIHIHIYMHMHMHMHMHILKFIDFSIHWHNLSQGCYSLGKSGRICSFQPLLGNIRECHGMPGIFFASQRNLHMSWRFTFKKIVIIMLQTKLSFLLNH